MGYTHYWKNSTIDQIAWEHIRSDFEKLLVACPVEIDNQSNDSEIFFNGVGDDAHEAFVFKKSTNSEFCKTARKPYDILAAAMLAVIVDLAFQVEVSSDGDLDDQEWIDALEFASKTLRREIKLPFSE